MNIHQADRTAQEYMVAEHHVRLDRTQLIAHPQRGHLSAPQQAARVASNEARRP